jgi:DNA-binding MarR family transcriptional regulator
MSHRGPFLLLFATGRQLSSLLADVMVDAPLTPDEFAVASVLRLEAPVRQKDLAALTGLPPTTLAHYLRRFEADGLVARERDPADGRAVLLELTPEGIERTESCFPAFATAITTFQKALADEGVPEIDVIDVLEAMSRAFDVARARVRSEGSDVRRQSASQNLPGR